MKKSQKIGIYILSGGVITLIQVGRRYCKIKAKEKKSKFFVYMDNAFEFVGNFIENVMAVSMVVSAFL